MKFSNNYNNLFSKIFEYFSFIMYMSKNRLRHYNNENTKTKNLGYNWLIDYISKLIKKVGGVKDKTLSLFKTNVYGS